MNAKLTAIIAYNPKTAMGVTHRCLSCASVAAGLYPESGWQPAEVVEGRGVAEGNAGETPADRTQSREKAYAKPPSGIGG